jgi:hypothetical protein
MLNFAIAFLLGYFSGIAVELYIQKYERDWKRKHGEE